MLVWNFLKRFAFKIGKSIYQEDLRIASIYGVFLMIISDIYTTISVFA